MPSFEERCQRVLESAREIASTSEDWVAFFRCTLGREGVVQQQFQGEELLRFTYTPEHLEIEKLLKSVRESYPAADTGIEPVSVITVRIPKSVHDALRAEAEQLKTSLNKLCITKLLHPADPDYSPQEGVGRRRRHTVSSDG